MVNVKKEDLRTLLLATMRYSIGRMTYMPDLSSELIRKHKEVLNEYDLKQIIKEIEEHDVELEGTGLRTSELGMDCDVQTWHNLRDWCLVELGHRVQGEGKKL